MCTHPHYKKQSELFKIVIFSPETFRLSQVVIEALFLKKQECPQAQIHINRDHTVPARYLEKSGTHSQIKHKY